MTYYLYTIDFGYGKMTGLQVADENIGKAFSLQATARNFKLQQVNVVLLFLKTISGSEASTLYYERVGSDDSKFYEFEGDVYLSGRDPRKDYSLL